MVDINIFILDVIHTVGPIGEKPNLLQSAYKQSMQVMAENDLKSIVCINNILNIFNILIVNMLFII